MSKARKIGIIIIVSALILLVILITSDTEKEQPKKIDGGLQNIINNSVNKSKNSTEKKKLDSPDFIIANKVMAEFFTYINKKEFDKAYLMIDELYKKDFEITEELLQAKYSFDNEKIFTVTSLYKTDDERIAIDVVIENTQKSNGKQSIEKGFTIYKKGDGKYSLADIVLISEHSQGLKNDIKQNVSATLYKTFSTVNGTIAIVNLENGTGNDLNIKHSEFGFYAEQAGNVYPHRLLNNMIDNYIVAGGTKKMYYLVFQQSDMPQTIGMYDLGENPPGAESDGMKVELFNLK